MFPRVVLTLAVLVACAAAATRWHQLDGYSHADYELEFGKKYADDAERSLRRQLFETKLAGIRRHNMDPTKTWKEGVNQFTDRTEAEFKALLGYDQTIGYARREAANLVRGGRALRFVALLFFMTHVLLPLGRSRAEAAPGHDAHGQDGPRRLARAGHRDLGQGSGPLR